MASLNRARCAPRHPLPILVCLVALSGCGGAPGSSELDADNAPRLVAEADVRIGNFDDPSIGFSRIFGVDLDHEGNVYVFEGLDSQIRVYNLAGELLRRIGGPGDGPGEFSGIPRFGVHGDTVWANDQRAGRITLFDRAGNVLSTGRTTNLRVPLPDGFAYVLPYMMGPDGRFSSFVGRVGGSSRNDPTGVDENDPIPVPRVLFDATGAVVDTIGWDPSPPPRMVPPPGYGEGRFQRVTVGSRPVYVPDPPTELAYWITLHDGRIVIDSPTPSSADDAAFTVTRIGLDGDTVYSRSYTYDPIAFTSEDLDSIAMVGARGGNVFVNGVPQMVPDQEAAAAFRAIRAEMKFPEYRQALRSARTMNDDRLWLQRDAPADADSARWLILDADGGAVGELALPSGVRVLWSRGDTLWVSEQDELDVPWLVRYRLSGG